MRKLNGFLGFWALVMLSATANAQIQIVIDNQTIPTSDIESIVILPNSNLISVTTTVPYTVEQAGATTTNAVAITGFSASPATITEGQSTTLSWSTQNATSCAASGGGGGWSTKTIGIPNGSTTVTLTTAKTYNFTLTCQGSSSPVSRVTAVVVNTKTVTPPPEPSSCGTPALSNGIVTNWEDFWPASFPLPGSDSRLMSVPKSSYRALKFNTGDISDDGKLSLYEFTGTTGIRRGTISECPGDFNVNFSNDPTDCSKVWGLGGGIRWATNGRSGSCQLKPNTEYYFNVTFTDGADSKTSTCVNISSSGGCRVELKHTNL